MSEERFYYSALEAELAAAPMQPASIETWTQYLGGKVNQGKVKADELKYTCLIEQMPELADDSKIRKADLNSMQHETQNGMQLSFEISHILEQNVKAGQQLFSFAPLYSLDTRENSDFAQAVNSVANGEKVTGYIKLGTTPEVLKLLTVPDLEVTVGGAVLHKAILGKHNIAPEVLKQLPREINNPVAIMLSRTQENSYVVLTELTEKEKNTDKPVIAALHVKKIRNNLELINIASVYGRSQSQIKKGLEHDLLYWHKTKGSQFLNRLALQLRPGFDSVSENLSVKDIKSDSDLSQEKYHQTKALLTEKLGDAARLITLTDKLPDGAPLLGEGVHLRGSREHGQTYLNPERIHPLYDSSGKEILSRDERVLWVAHHELFHRGISVIGAEVMRTELEKADRNDFVHQLANAITAERQQIAPEAAPRTRLEAVEEALAEIHAARQNQRMDALIARYQTHNPALQAPKEQTGWHARFSTYAKTVKNTLNRLSGRETEISHQDITALIRRVSGQAAQEILTPELQRDKRHSVAPRYEHTATTNAGASLCLNIDGLCAREIGKAAYKAIEGDIQKLPELSKALAAKGYKLDERALLAAAGHPITLQDAFTKAVSKAPAKNPAAPAQTYDKKADLNSMQHETQNGMQLSFEISHILEQNVKAGQQLFSFAPLYSLDTRGNSRFMQAIDRIVTGDYDKSVFIQMGSTPEPLLLVGAENTRISIHSFVLEKAMGEYLNLPKRHNKNQHNVSPETMKKLPQSLNDPVAIFKSINPRNGETAYIVLTELVEINKQTQEPKPLIAAFHLEKTKKGLNITNIKSVYGRTRQQIQKAIANDLLYWHTEKGQQLSYAFGLQLSSKLRNKADLLGFDTTTLNNLSQSDTEKGRQFLNTHPLQLHWDLTSEADLIKTQHDLSQEKYHQTKALLTEKLGDAARLITLTDKLPDGAPLLGEGVHLRGSREHGQTYLNPERIHPLYDSSGKEILSRDERVLWVAHHELFHRGISVIGAEVMRTELEKADRNDFVHQLANAITAERQQIAPEAAPRTRLEAVEEALAEIHAARQNQRMDALIARYQTHNPALQAPKEQTGWHARFSTYAKTVKNTLNRLSGRETEISHQDITALIRRVSGQAAQEILTPELQRDKRHSVAPRYEHTATTNAGASLCLNIDGLCAREIGKAAYKAIEGDIQKLPELSKALAAKGYKLDERALLAAAGHPITLQDAFTKAVSKAPAKNPAAPALPIRQPVKTAEISEMNR